jgi:hypothetical protein
VVRRLIESSGAENFIEISDYLHQLPIRQDKDDPDSIPIDGKTIRKSENKGKANKAIHMVSALSV